MKGFLTDSPPMVLWKYLNERTGVQWSADFKALARVEDMEIQGVVGYNNFTGSSCQMHYAGESKHWMTREHIRASFRYPFITLGLKVILLVVPSGNTHALKVDRKFGFKDLIYIPDAHPDGGLHILQMRKEECRWLGSEDNG